MPIFNNRTMRPMTQPVEPERERRTNENQPRVESTQPTAQQTTGRPGTISLDEFASLESLINKYGPEVVTEKIAKVCKKKAENLKREYARSIIAKAYEEFALKLESFI